MTNWGDGLYYCLTEGCRNLAAEDDRGVLAWCWSCLAARDGQAPVADDAVPAHVAEVPTMRVRTPSDAELMAELAQHAEAGQ